jgi:hypothetical protein
MNNQDIKPNRWLYSIIGLVILLGALISAFLFKKSGITMYPALITDAYREEQHHLNVPGSRDVKLTRTGAYGIYYERSMVPAAADSRVKMPPAIECSLTSQSTGAKIEAVHDYVETNRYWFKDQGGSGVLIMSVMVDTPDIYTFTCHYQDRSKEPEVVVALGPNYFWEFLRVAWKIGLPLLGSIGLICGSLLLALITVVVVAIKRLRIAFLTLLALVTFSALVLGGCGLVRLSDPVLHTCSDPDFIHCTIFTVSQDGQVFFGGNGDWMNFDSNYYWVDPGSDTAYGAIYFGVPENVQQGFNEKGLAYDSNGLPLAPVITDPGRKPVYGSYASYPIQILRACATVEEVIAWIQEHQWHEAMHDQLHFADATGDAVVISAGPDGQLAFTRKPDGDGFLISTNFNLANPNNGNYPCWRYDRAKEMLEEIADKDYLTAEYAASILDAVHVESTNTWTVMSVVGDLPQGLVYVYLFHQFDAPIILNVAEEIASAPAPGPLRDLFPAETLRQADQAFELLAVRSTHCNIIGITWLGLVAVSLLILFFLARSNLQGLAFWVLMVAVLGPVGLIVWLVAARNRRMVILVETVGDLPPCVGGLVVAILTTVLLSGINQNALLQILAIYGFPFIIGLFLYQGMLLNRLTRISYLRTILRRLPIAIVTMNLVLAGLLAISMPLIKWHLEYCGFSCFSVLSWWAISVLGALAGGVLLFTYHAWAFRRGFAAWSVLLWGTHRADSDKTTISSPSWRQLWLWIVASYVILAAGMVLAMMCISVI